MTGFLVGACVLLMLYLLCVYEVYHDSGAKRRITRRKAFKDGVWNMLLKFVGDILDGV